MRSLKNVVAVWDYLPSYKRHLIVLTVISDIIKHQYGIHLIRVGLGLSIFVAVYIGLDGELLGILAGFLSGCFFILLTPQGRGVTG